MEDYKFHRQGNLDREGDWYERGRVRLQRARIQLCLLWVALIGVTVAYVFKIIQC